VKTTHAFVQPEQTTGGRLFATIEFGDNNATGPTGEPSIYMRPLANVSVTFTCDPMTLKTLLAVLTRMMNIYAKVHCKLSTKYRNIVSREVLLTDGSFYIFIFIHHF